MNPLNAKPLFVAGSPRSGTTALISYLNRHEQILVCRERYKYLSPREITPRLFTLERILDFREGETNQSAKVHAELVRRKDPAQLRWVGDKYPLYTRHLGTLARRNRGARFLVLFRPVEEVAESFEARASDPNDGWPRENGFERGIELWNAALRRTRRYVRRRPRPTLMLVDYERFFSDPDTHLPLLSDFLGLEFDPELRATWHTMSAQFEARRRRKAELTEEQAALIAAGKDHGLERWARAYLERQFAGDPPWRSELAARPRRPLGLGVLRPGRG